VADARVLLRGRRYAAAYYLCGYAVECALKACVARQSVRGEFPDLNRVRDSHTHDLSRLVRVAGLEASLAAERRSDPQFNAYWATILDWSEQGRYENRTAPEARDLLISVDDRQHGVLQWVKRHW
jgi:hypothetical protein